MGQYSLLTYDQLGRKISMNDPDMGQWSYSYDALGNLINQTDAKNCTLTLSYDLLNRLTGKASSGAGCGTQVNSSYSYDAGANGIGRRTGMTDASGSSAWSYDSRGRLINDTRSFGSNGTYVTAWTYNSADLPLTQTYPDGEVVSFSYDARLLLTSLTGTDTYVSSTSYDSAGRMTARTLGNGLSQNYNYYAWNQQGGRLQSLVTGSLQNLSYQYDLNGNINSIADGIASETQSFSYDSLDRLTAATVTGGPAPYAETFGYDAATGNLTTKGNLTLTYNDAAHVHAATSMGNNSYSYDANGNQVSRNIYSDGNYTLLYDAENRLVQVKKNSQVLADFTYNGDGQRVISDEGGQVTLYLGAVEILNPQQGTPPSVPIQTPFNYNGTWTKHYTAGASRIAMRTCSGTTCASPLYILSDHLGSSTLVTDASGAVVAEMKYKACPLRGCFARVKSAIPAERCQPTIPTPDSFPTLVRADLA